jgi:peptidoglycan/LPS O-acetylase OafA/YrhL
MTGWRSAFRGFRLYPLVPAIDAAGVRLDLPLAELALKESGLELFKQVLAWLTFDRPDINQYRHSGMLISNVTWTLAYEVFFYLALPLAGLVFIYRGGWLQTVLCLIGIYALYQIIGWEHSLKKHFLASFLGGIAAAYWIRRPALVAWSQSRLAGASSPCSR